MFTRPPVLTDMGKTLLLRAAAGEQITFTKFQVGDGALAHGETEETALALKHVVIDDLPITLAEDTEEDGYIKITGSFDSHSHVQEDFVWAELGLIAEDEDGVEYLYAYAYEAEYAELLKVSGADVAVEQTFSVIIAIGDSENITVYVLPHTTYADKADFDAHVADHNNPHQVTAAQAGAAPAVHTHDAGTDITTGVLPVERGGTGVASYAALAALLAALLDANFIIGHFIGDGAFRKDITLGFQPSRVYMLPMFTGWEPGDSLPRAGGFSFAPGENLYHQGCGDSAATCDADALFARRHGGAAVTETGFAAGYGNSAGRQDININGKMYFYIAMR